MDLGLRNRVALVTGASSGLGRAVALELAREGAIVALAARRADLLDEAARAAKDAGAPNARAFTVDQDRRGAMSELVRSVRDTFGRVDIVIANGGGPKPGTFSSVGLDDWDTAYGGILRSMLELVYEAVPPMRANGWGRIVALTSSSVKQPIPNLVLSSAFRTALTSALKTLSGEVAPDGVTVNTIATGRFMTDRLLKLSGGDEAIVRKSAEADIPMRRVGTTAEFAALAAFLASERASFITGQTIAIDGGAIQSLY